MFLSPSFLLFVGTSNQEGCWLHTEKDWQPTEPKMSLQEPHLHKSAIHKNGGWNLVTRVFWDMLLHCSTWAEVDPKPYTALSKRQTPDQEVSWQPKAVITSTLSKACLGHKAGNKQSSYLKLDTRTKNALSSLSLRVQWAPQMLSFLLCQIGKKNGLPWSSE